jgi:outer membrane murein-binding lipoprotein Lpp
LWEKETIMLSYGRCVRFLAIGLMIFLATIVPVLSLAQGGPSDQRQAATDQSADDVKTLSQLVRQLQDQVQSLNARVQTLEANEKAARSESGVLREQLAAKRVSAAGSNEANADVGIQTYTAPVNSPSTNAQAVALANTPQTSDEQISRLDENIELANAQIREQSQTKVESSSKYRVRLSGLALFNLFTNRGIVDNEDVPQIAKPAGLLDSNGTFGGSLRQSQIGLEAFGPDVAGAHTQAEIRFDFAGGFPQAPNGSLTGLVRLRTGTVRFDWINTSIIAGQDYLFFSPLTPTSYASLAIPAFSYSGNLWGWTPQVRVEHRVHLSETSSINLEAGILQTLSGDTPGVAYERTATWGEKSGRPGYAARMAWRRSAFGQDIIAGVGGYYGRQDWGFSRSVNSWASTADLTIPFGRLVEFTGQFYRGRAVGGLGGAIGQSVLWNGQFSDPNTEVYGLDSMGGWVQLKLKPTTKFEVNGAFGDDNPFASDLREFIGNPIYSNSLLSKNQTSLINFIYRPRSDLVFSIEYKHLKTFTLDRNFNSANNINLIVGYIF